MNIQDYTLRVMPNTLELCDMDGKVLHTYTHPKDSCTNGYYSNQDESALCTFYEINTIVGLTLSNPTYNRGYLEFWMNTHSLSVYLFEV